MNASAWTWDETLYAGSAEHYLIGRMPYPPELATALVSELGLDGTGRLLDVGCGPGPLTRVLAPHFAAAVGIDADPGMISVAREQAPEIEWRQMRAELLPGDLGSFRVLTFAQSFHWMDQPLVARLARPMLDPGGAWVHVGASTHRGLDGDDPLPLPRPPWDEIDALVAGYLGPVRRAGRGTLPGGTVGGEDDVMLAAGWRGPVKLEIDRGEVVTRSVDEMVSAVLSLSSSAPHQFGADLPRFVADLRKLLLDASPSGQFAERLGSIELSVWQL